MKSKIVIALAIVIGMTAVYAVSQQQGWINPRAVVPQMLRVLGGPFTGITSDGTVRPGLYAIQETGISTGPVVSAARDLLTSLRDEQRESIRFTVDDSEWRNWANIHRFPRQGVSLDEMTDAQRERAYALLRASLSEKGYETSRDIMRLNHHLGELVSNFSEYGEHLYWFTLMGDPSEDHPWGWQIDGHHLVINYFVLGDQVVMTPTFMGSEPIEAMSGKYKGAVILEQEQAQALLLMQSLPSQQQQAARIAETKKRSHNQAEMFKDNVVVPYEGLRVDQMSEAHQDALMDLIGQYVGNIRDGHALIKMDEVSGHLDETYFAWVGETDPDAVFYYRIHSPVILIEFDHQGPIALGGMRDAPTRQHIHTVVRTPNGNDYGKDLLRQHYTAFADDPTHGHAAD